MDEDPPKLPSIEEEFAELDAELKRISAMPVTTVEQRNGVLIALEGLRGEWRAKYGTQPDAPVWRREVDQAIATAFDGLIHELQLSSDGNEHFRFDPKMIQSHVKPVFDALMEGLRNNLVQKFGKRPPPGAPPPKVDATDVAGMLVALFGPPKKK